MRSKTLKRINAVHDNSMDLGNPGMDRGKFRNNVLFSHIQFEMSETDLHRTIPGGRTSMQKNYSKYVNAYISNCGNGLENTEDEFRDIQFGNDFLEIKRTGNKRKNR